MTALLEREASVEVSNPLGIEGIEFVEYSTPRPQALGQVLESIGFRPIARHRSREVLLYRQGGMNIVVNGHGVLAADGEVPQIAAIALRVRDAGTAWRRVVDLGGWPVPVKVQPMELHIPGVHGAGASRIYFVDRWREFSIYDVDFVPIPTVDPRRAPRSRRCTGLASSSMSAPTAAPTGASSTARCSASRVLPAEQRFGILPRGSVLASPCGTFYLQLIEPDELVVDDTGERLQRVAFGAPDVPAAVKALRARGVEFVETDALHTEARGALTRPQLGGVMVELVHHKA